MFWIVFLLGFICGGALALGLEPMIARLFNSLPLATEEDIEKIRRS